MLRILSLFICLLLMVKAKSQSTTKDTATFSIFVQNEKQIPAEGATIQLIKAKDSSLVKTAIADAKGIATFKGIKVGTYKLLVNFAGYKPMYSHVYGFPAASGNKTVIALQPAVGDLKEVSVTSRKPFIQRAQGKTIVNVDASITNVGTTILEVLEKSPGVTVDKDGGITLQGKNAVMVMIDDKPTYLSGTELSNMLGNMNSSQVETIELITSPSARYDAAGNAGIINIKTKKNKQVGFNGTFTTAYSQGRYPKNNNSLVLNYRNGSFNMFFNYSMNANKQFSELYALRSYFNPNSSLASVLDQPTYFTNKGFSNTVKTGVDYYASKKTTFGLALTGILVKRSGTGDATATWKQATGAVDSAIITTSTSGNHFKNGGISLYARHTISKTQDFSVDADYLAYDIFTDQYFMNRLSAPGGYTEASRGDIPSRINIFSAKADYTLRYGNNGKFEAGAKSSHINTDNIADYQQFDGSQWKADYGKSNHFLYTENIYASYATLEQKYKRITMQLGLRYEYTHYNANQLGNAITKDSSFSRRYDGLFPSGYLTYEADSSNSFTFTAGRRIDRPAFQKLNPFEFIINKYTFQRGNPFFLPQYTWNMEISHQYKQLLTTTVAYSIIKDYFSQLFLTDANTNNLVYTEGNVGRMHNLAVSVSVQAAPFKWWSFTAQSILNYKKFNGYVWNNFNSDITQLNTNINNQFKIGKSLTTELSGFYTTKARNDLQELLSPTGQVAIGASLPVLKKKGTLKLSIRDMFYTQVMEGVTAFQYASEYFTFRRDSRVVNLAFTYRFGKPLKVAKRSSGAARDEMDRVGGG